MDGRIALLGGDHRELAKRPSLEENFASPFRFVQQRMQRHRSVLHVLDPQRVVEDRRSYTAANASPLMDVVVILATMTTIACAARRKTCDIAIRVVAIQSLMGTAHL